MMTREQRAFPTSRFIRSVVFAASTAFFCSSAFAAAACTSDTLSLQGRPLGITLCPQNGATEGSLRATERLVYQGRTIERSADLHVPVAGHSIHIVDDVPLAALGLDATLHLTLALHNGSLAVEHAVTLPGPIILR